MLIERELRFESLYLTLGLVNGASSRGVLAGMNAIFFISLALALPAGQVSGPLLAPAPGSSIPVAGGPQNIRAGDVNNDGIPDLVTANGKGRSLAVLLGDGRGGFRHAPGSPVSVPGGAGEFVLDDLNGDRRLDVAVTDHDSYNVAVLLGDGRGGFSPAPGSPFRFSEGKRPHTHGLAGGDLNKDGRPDLVAVNNEDNNVSVMLGDGRGRFAPAPGSPFSVGPGPYPLALGDVNGDGVPDIVTPGSQSRDGNITVLLGNGRGGFRPAPGSPYSAAPNPYYVTVADVNADKKIDVIASHNDASLASILLGDGRGGFAAPAAHLRLQDRAWGVEAGDINRDGAMDLLMATNRSVSVLLGDGKGAFAPAPGSPYPSGPGTWRLALADFNRDGKLDVAASNVESDTVAVLLAR